MMPRQNEPMFRALRSMLDILRELIFALIWQPSRPGPTKGERQVNEVQRDNLPEQLQVPATSWDAAKQVGKEVGKAAILQPTPAPKRRKQ